MGARREAPPGDRIGRRGRSTWVCQAGWPGGVVAPRLGAPKYVAGPPKRFAQGMGAALTTTAAVLGLGFGLTTAGDVLTAMLVVAATLESVFALCVGCQVFALLTRAGVVPEETCERCADVWSQA